MPTIIQPFDFSQVTLQSLIDGGKLLPANGNKVWAASIFPSSKSLNVLPHTDKDHQVTKLDDSLFAGFVTLDRVNQDVPVNRGSGRRYIKSVEIGDFNDSVKRYTQLDRPVDYSTDAQTFLNLPRYDFALSAQLDITKETVVKSPINLDTFARRAKPEIFAPPINHPHITYPAPSPLPFKNNNKAVIMQIFSWAKAKGIKYIYCINEWRPYCVTEDYTTPYVYYTVKGSF
jgi:hypothetical protein